MFVHISGYLLAMSMSVVKSNENYDQNSFAIYLLYNVLVFQYNYSSIKCAKNDLKERIADILGAVKY